MKGNSQRATYAAIAASVLVPVILLFPGLVEPRAFVGALDEDAHTLFYPWRAFAFGRVRDGVFPLWNPYLLCGMPFVAAVESAVFYPPNFLFVILPTAVALDVSLLVHLVAAGLFVQIWLAQLGVRGWPAAVAGVSFQMAAPIALRIYAGNLSVLCAAAWMPLVFWIAERLLEQPSGRAASLGGVILALQVLAGHPQTTFYGLLLASVYFAARLVWRVVSGEWRGVLKAVFWASVVGLVAVGIAAVQWVPSFDLTTQAVRGEGLPIWEAGRFSLPPEALASFLVPSFFGDERTAPWWGRNNPWEMTGYVGLVPLALGLFAIICRRDAVTRTLVIAAVAAVVLAMGKYTPLFGILYRWLPGYGAFRGSAKFLMPLALLVAVLGGLGGAALSDAIGRGWGRHHQLSDYARHKVGAVVVVAVMMLIAVGLVVFNATVVKQSGRWSMLVNHLVAMPDHLGIKPGLVTDEFLEQSAACAARGFRRTVFVLCVLAVGLVLARRTGRVSAVGPAVLVGVAILDGLWFAGPYVVLTPEEACHWPQQLVAAMRQTEQPMRAATARRRLLNFGMVERLCGVDGMHPMPFLRYQKFYLAMVGEPQTRRYLAMVVARPSALTRQASVEFFLWPVSARGLEEVVVNDKVALYRDPAALPRARVVGNVISGPPVQALEEARAGMVDLTDAVILEVPVPLRRAPSEQFERDCRIVVDAPEKVVVEAYLERSGYLVLADAFCFGWRCAVENLESASQPVTVSILRANLAFRAVPLDAGRWRVTFLYEPASFKVGLLVTLATGGALAGVFCGAKAHRMWKRWSS